MTTKQLILGTAGHIDHGKTALVRLLTGIDTDRLKEEKQRGITIELGFAWLDLPDKTHIGIVDVPGHEKFVRTMVAGVGGINLVCLVISAEEGIMPQTREHFDICRVLNVKHGLIALTKSDLIDDEWLELVTDDVRQYVEGTFLADATIVPVSSTTGDGKQNLIDAIEQVAQTIKPRSSTDLLRLPVDRVFTMKGFGTVITGTCVGGTIEVGQTVEILPSQLTAKVRGLQVHGESVDRSGAGLRTAVNLQGIEKSQVLRGEVLVKPGSLPTTYLVDVRIDHLASAPRPLEYRTRVRFNHHTSEILARIVPLSSETIAPGQSGTCQLRLEQPAVVLTGDKFVLRSYSPMTTIGGGTVLNPRPKKHKRPFDRALKDLKVLESGEPKDKVVLYYDGAQTQGLRLSNLPALTGISKKALLTIYRDLLGKGRLVRFDTEDDIAVTAEVFDRICNAVVARLKTFHQENPTIEGLSRKELSDKIEYGVPTKLIAKTVARLEKDSKVKRSGDRVSLKQHEASLQGDMERFGIEILAAIVDGGTTPPTFKDLVAIAGKNAKAARQVVDLLIQQQRIVKVSDDLYYAPQALEKLKSLVRNEIEAHDDIEAKRFKELSGTSRKFAIPLLEYFDTSKFTLRVGDKRILRKPTGH